MDKEKRKWQILRIALYVPLWKDSKSRRRWMRIRPFDLRSRIAFVARLGSNDRDICARHLFILPQEYDGLIRDTRGSTREIGLWYKAEPVCFRYVVEELRGELIRTRFVSRDIHEERNSRSVSWYENLILASSYLDYLESDARDSSKEFNSVRLAALIFCHENVVIIGLKQNVFNFFRQTK